MRLIDADALEEIVQGGIKDNPHKDGFARVCHRTEYTHFLDVIRRMPTIAPPPNAPLTLEQLRDMEGEPVWCVVYNLPKGGYYCLCDKGVIMTPSGLLYECGDIPDWTFLRRKPEECENIGR